ncbi:MAG: hypothetical protein WC708_01635 [Lentisphaeria bacterium]|jgi:hypothetical protein
MKFLVNRSDNSVRSAHAEPVRFSVSGRYLVDVPDGLTVKAKTGIFQDLIDEKLRAFRTQLAATVNLTYTVYDELISPADFLISPGIDLNRCLYYSFGPGKRVEILPNGYVLTNPIIIPVDTSAIFVHWYGFTLYSNPGDPSDTPQPPQLLYNYDVNAADFIAFNPSNFEVFILGYESLVTSGPIGPGDTSFGVANAGGYPTSFPFMIVIDDEMMQVDGIFSNTLIVTRNDGVAHNASSVAALHLASPTSDSRLDLALFGGSDIRLRFKNISTTSKYLSDWLLLHDSVVSLPT